MSGYDCRNKRVFADNVGEDVDLMSSGKLFRGFAPAEADNRSPVVTRRD